MHETWILAAACICMCSVTSFTLHACWQVQGDWLVTTVEAKGDLGCVARQTICHYKQIRLKQPCLYACQPCASPQLKLNRIAYSYFCSALRISAPVHLTWPLVKQLWRHIKEHSHVFIIRRCKSWLFIQATLHCLLLAVRWMVWPHLYGSMKNKCFAWGHPLHGTRHVSKTFTHLLARQVHAIMDDCLQGEGCSQPTA